MTYSDKVLAANKAYNAAMEVEAATYKAQDAAWETLDAEGIGYGDTGALEVWEAAEKIYQKAVLARKAEAHNLADEVADEIMLNG